MSEGKDQERTEQATPKRREDARKKGQVAQSREIPSAFVLSGALGVFFFAGAWMFWRISEIMKGVFRNIGSFQFQAASIYNFLQEVCWELFLTMMPLMSLVLIAGVGANLVQVGFMINSESLSPKLSKLDPVKGIKRMFSLKSFAELVKSLVKILLVGGVAFLMVKGEAEVVPYLMQMCVQDILDFAGRVTLKIWFFTCLVLVVLAALDYAFQRWQHEKDLKMSKQEVKDETKQREGDPSVKAKIRSIQREMARRRMMNEVPGADVVITNPTRLAVALKYKAEGMAAPQVMAKGAGFIAARIKEIARENDVPIVEQKPLAQALYKVVEIGDYIPVNLYRAVAEVLAYVYGLKKNRG